MPEKIQYRSKLYLGESISADKLEKIKKRLEHKPLRAGVYLIAAARNGMDQLEIYSCGLLAQKYYRNNPPYVVGIAGSYEEAVGIIEQLAGECWRVRGDCLLREYLSC